MVDLDFLASIPIFSFFTRIELEAAEKLCKEHVFAKDETVVRIGEPGETFYVVLEGELEVWDASTPPRQTGTLRRGDYFGEMALLQEGKRTATVTVARRARLLEIDKPAFDHLFLRRPKAIEYFARVLSKRLAGVTRAERIHRTTTAIAVGSVAGLKGETLVARSLALLLKRLTDTEVAYVEVRPGTEASQPGILNPAAGEFNFGSDRWAPPNENGQATVLKMALPLNVDRAACGDLMSNMVARLSDSFTFIVFDLGSHAHGLIESAPAFADVFVALVDRGGDNPGPPDLGSTKVYRVVNLFNPTSPPIPISGSEPFVIPYSGLLSKPVDEASAFIAANPRSAPGLPLCRLAHRLLGTSIGLALGGGAAFGLAHLGVLRVLEEAAIPIDLVAGCSQGSIVAIGYAAGIPVTEMIDIARELGTRRNFLFASDPTFFLKPGILSGQRFVTIMRPYLKGKETFEHLLLPCRTVATDIETGERIAIGSGRLESAYRASSSVPMVLAPLREGERVLVDGGVADPVPAEVAMEMGADITIAVNVVPPMKRGVETVLSSFYRRMNAFNPLSYLGDGADMPNLFDIVMNSMQILQYELGNFKAISADVLINPDLSDYTWIEYYRADELIERGAEAATKALPAIRKILDNRLHPIRAARSGAVEKTSV
ncbi:MAG TPA: patatin-like phospholipase family protein [Vicinamibacterales bacterium]